MIKCIGEKLREKDPLRWDSIPITFGTNFRNSNGQMDIRTAIYIHDALEKEFLIEIKDRCMLISDMEEAYYVVKEHHDSH